MKLALAIASILILAVHGFVFYNQFFHRWERHQTAYFDQARSMSKSDRERAALADRSPRIEQAIVTQFGETRVDRCQTCHIAMDDPRFAGHAQPLKTHPYSAAMGDRQVKGKWERAHKFSDFGCTVCHGGQGRGLQTHYAHGEDHYWPEPLTGYVTQATWRKDLRPKLVGKEFMQANCAQCHTEQGFEGTNWVERGRKVFYQSNCFGCHKIEGISDGTLGPDLTEVGHKFKADYLYESIVEPRANSATSFMPKFNLAPDDVKALTIFLQSRRGYNLAETGIQRFKARLAEAKAAAPTSNVPTTGAAAVAAGEKLVNDYACLACHKLDSKDGGVAPDLSYAGSLHDRDWLMEHFKNPRSRVPDSVMPTFKYADEDFEAITAFLLTKRASLPANTPPADIYKTLCLRCHGEKGDGHGPIAIYLDPYPRDLTKAAFMNSKTMDRLTHSLANGVAGTSMPGWKNVLSPEQINGVLDYVAKQYTKDPRRPLKERKVPETNPVAFSQASADRGEKIFAQRCGGCHGRKADGKGPNSIDILPRPRNLLNPWFVQATTDKRFFDSILYGVQGTAMPAWIDYGMTNNDVGDIVNFIRNSNRKPGAPNTALLNFPQERTRHGRDQN
jgi:mono/diheme cytochrome c family protein